MVLFPLFSCFFIALDLIEKLNQYFLFYFRLATPLQSGQQPMSQSMSGTNNVGPNCQLSGGGGSSPLVMPGFPIRTSHSAHAPHYSPYSPSR